MNPHDLSDWVYFVLFAAALAAGPLGAWLVASWAAADEWRDFLNWWLGR